MVGQDHVARALANALSSGAPPRAYLFSGPRGTGKTEILLSKFAGHCGKGHGLKWRGIIFRREYKHLDDIISKSKVLFRQLRNPPTWLSSKSDYKWVYWTAR